MHASPENRNTEFCLFYDNNCNFYRHLDHHWCVVFLETMGDVIVEPGCRRSTLQSGQKQTLSGEHNIGSRLLEQEKVRLCING